MYTKILVFPPKMHCSSMHYRDRGLPATHMGGSEAVGGGGGGGERGQS